MKNWMRKTIALLLALMLVTGAVAFAEKKTVSDAFRLPAVSEKAEDKASTEEEAPAEEEEAPVEEEEAPVEEEEAPTEEEEIPAEDEELIEGEEAVEEEIVEEEAVEENEAEVEPEGPIVIGKAAVNLTDTSARLNVRAEASKSSDVLGSLDNGTEVSVLADEGDWLKIVYGEGEGYIKVTLTTWGAVEEEIVEEPVDEEPVIEEVVISEFEVSIGIVDPKEMYFEGDVVRIVSNITGECNQPSYQWQVLRANGSEQNWNDIEGATAPYYEYVLSINNCEDSYRVIVVDQAPTMGIVPVEEIPTEV